MWIIILLIVIAIIIAIVVKNKNKAAAKEEENKRKEEELKQQQQQVLQEIGPAIKEKWAVCLSRFGREQHLPPCLIKIEDRKEKDNIVVAIRLVKGQELEALFVVDEEEVDEESYSYTGHHPKTGDFGGVYIKALDEDERTEYPKAKCSLIVYNQDEYNQRNASFYLVVDFVAANDVDKVLAAM